MGRLFSKFFLAFLLAQCATAIGVGTLIWLAGPEPHLPEPHDVWVPDGAKPPPDYQPDDHHPAPPEAYGLAGPGADGALHPPRLGLSADRPPPPGMAGPGRWWERRHRHGFPYLPVGVALLASTLFAFLLARHFAGPILALRNAFAEVGRGNLKLRLGPGSASRPDELESLRTDFDASTERLEILVEGQRRLLHDVSHEVRSPVARLQLALDLIGQQPARAEELLGRMGRECERINQLMEELLTLSRLEARAYGTLDEDVDLAELLHAIAEDAGFEGQARSVRVELDCPDSLNVRGRAELLHRALENVVRNALGHSPDGGLVQICASARAGAEPLRVRIEDQGDGVPAADLERMFQPFKRLANARDGGGHGLGLAITREAMAAHGGRAYAENRSEGGLRVILEFLPSPT